MTKRIDSMAEILRLSRRASHGMAVLEGAVKRRALQEMARLIEERRPDLLRANARDLRENEGRISPSLYQRLILDSSKLAVLAQGAREVAEMDDPVGRVLSRTLLDDGLTLEKQTVPLGVVAIIFESRPDVIPQILSLILKSGNAVLLKGGSEAVHSNRAFMALIEELNRRTPELPGHWATLLEGRRAVHELLDYPEYVDLVIPRGSNQLVRSIMSATKIPVLGHADGVCCLYVHAEADLERSVRLALDCKTQYPAACNSIETLLVDESIAEPFLRLFGEAASAGGVRLKGCKRTRSLLAWAEPATETDWRTEYGDLTLAVRIVDGLDEAVQHINEFGSHHTDAIATRDSAAAEEFLNRVDSASVFANASTRFADGFRYGLGAELGISTARTHARGPVGLEGLLIYKYKLRGEGQTVAEYTGKGARQFRHEDLRD